MTHLPSGTVTFLFTDIEGSTRLAQQYPGQWESLRGRHHASLQAAMDSQKGDYSESCAYYEQAIMLCEKVGILPSWVQAHLAYAELRRGNPLRAKELFKVCIQQFQKANMGTGLVFVIEGLASLDTNQGDPERATRLFACAEVHRARGGDLRPSVEQDSVQHDLDVIHSQLDEAAFDRAWDEGSVMTLDQALVTAWDEAYE